MDRIRGFVTQKLGPLPLWAWAGIVLALLVGYWYFKKAGPFSSANNSTGTDQSTQPSDLAGMLGAGGGGLTPNPASSGPVPTNYGPYISAATTVGSGYGGASTVPSGTVAIPFQSSIVNTLGSNAPGFRDASQSVATPSGIGGLGAALSGAFRQASSPLAVPTSSGRTGAQSF